MLCVTEILWVRLFPGTGSLVVAVTEQGMQTGPPPVPWLSLRAVAMGPVLWLCDKSLDRPWHSGQSAALCTDLSVPPCLPLLPRPVCLQHRHIPFRHSRLLSNTFYFPYSLHHSTWQIRILIVKYSATNRAWASGILT